jgi:hypothetical protein
MIALDHLGTFPVLLLELEEVDVETRSRKQRASERAVNTLESPVADQAANDRSVLLFGERLVVLL